MAVTLVSQGGTVVDSVFLIFEFHEFKRLAVIEFDLMQKHAHSGIRRKIRIGFPIFRPGNPLQTVRL